MLRGAVAALLPIALFASCEGLLGPTGTCQGPQVFGPANATTNVAYTDDCDGPDSVLGDVYVITLLEQTNFSVMMDADGFRAQMVMYEGLYGALPDDPRLIFDVVGSGVIGAHVFLPAGTYTIWAGSGEREGGSYSLTTAPVTTSPCSGNYFNYYVPGAVITGQILAADCVAGTLERQDAFGRWMRQGETVTVTLTMNKLGHVLFRRGGEPESPNVDDADVTADVPLEVTFTAPADGLFGVHVVSYPNNLGAASYTLGLSPGG
jgi:hypothetical protein